MQPTAQLCTCVGWRKLQGMGTYQAWLEMCAAVDTKMNLQEEIDCSATTWSQHYSILVRCVCEGH